MPLTDKGKKIMRSMKEQYGPEAGERAFYASRNKGVISGVDRKRAGGTVKSRDGIAQRGKTKGKHV